MPGRRTSPTCRLQAFRRRSGCVPAEPYPPLKRPRILQIKTILTTGPEHYSPFDRTGLSPFDRTATRDCEIGVPDFEDSARWKCNELNGATVNVKPWIWEIEAAAFHGAASQQYHKSYENCPKSLTHNSAQRKKSPTGAGNGASAANPTLDNSAALKTNRRAPARCTD